ncbi:hybrid sensor histidine kinase/response regulator [Labilithrix luteola]|uniref:hybrid sensor histidine kinase/response regulator n=1 Tax=Labilithrix luteola TaxID=1391654 RepID=UPI0014741452|nr:hybrid sensor histidine kinase/response regulator [Labilithrix luteola]
MKVLTVLLIEDDDADARMIREMLRRLPKRTFEIVHVTTMAAAPPHLTGGHIDAVLLDLSLPDSNGLESLEEIHELAPDKPLIVLTGNDDEEVGLRAVNTHAQDYLIKWHFTEHLLSRSIRYAVERQRINRDLEEAKNLAEAASRSKSEFLANVSHEIRTPMNAILGMADLLSETTLDDEQTKFVTRLRHAGDHLLALIDDLLDLAKIEAYRIKLANVPFDLHKLLDNTLGFLTVRAQARNIELRLRKSGDLPPALVGDPHRLRQVLVNLIGNAIKFTEEGYVEVVVERDPESIEPGALKFSVTDTGIGIAPDKLDLVFGRFAQLDASITRVRGGVGLGLAIARPLVERMHGRMQVVSTLGNGSTFWFTARFKPARTLPPDHAKPRLVPPPREQRPLRILLAEDAEDNQAVIESYLRNSPHTLEFAGDGASAFEMFASSSYDIVLMDVHMPIMDGLTSTRKMRVWEMERGLERAPILALTADAMSESLDRCLEAGCTDFLTKPIRKDVLLDALHRHSPAIPSSSSRPVLVAAKPVTPPPPSSTRQIARPALRPEPTRANGDEAKIVVRVDRDLYPMMPQFIRNRLNDVQKIRDALEASGKEDFDTIWTLGHNMKGSSAGYELAFAGELGGELATAAKKRDRDAIARIAADLATYLGRVHVVCTEGLDDSL